MASLLSQLQAIESDPTKLRGETFAAAAKVVARAIVAADPLGAPERRRPFPAIPYAIWMRSNDGHADKDFLARTEAVSLLEACRDLQHDHPGFTAVWG